MYKFIVILIIAQLLSGCTAVLNSNTLQKVQVGQSRDHVMTIVNQSPNQVIHTAWNSDDYIIYYYQLQVGTRSTNYCNPSRACFSKKTAITVPYLFIFKDANQPRLLFFGTLTALKLSIDATQRAILEQLQLLTHS